jgi:hypothetical protein
MQAKVRGRRCILPCKTRRILRLHTIRITTKPRKARIVYNLSTISHREHGTPGCPRSREKSTARGSAMAARQRSSLCPKSGFVITRMVSVAHRPQSVHGNRTRSLTPRKLETLDGATSQRSRNFSVSATRSPRRQRDRSAHLWWSLAAACAASLPAALSPKRAARSAGRVHRLPAPPVRSHS